MSECIEHIEAQVITVVTVPTVCGPLFPGASVAGADRLGSVAVFFSKSLGDDSPSTPRRGHITSGLDRGCCCGLDPVPSVQSGARLLASGGAINRTVLRIVSIGPSVGSLVQ